MNKQQKAELATIIATAVASAINAFDFGTDTKTVPTRTAKPTIAPKTQASRPNPFQRNADVNPDLVEIHVGTGKDNRIKLPKRIFDRNNRAYVNGTLYQGSDSDAGRCKVQASAFGAEAGDTIRIMRDAKNSNKWTAVLTGTAKRTATASKPKIEAKASPKITPKIKPQALKANGKTLDEILDEAAQQAWDGFNKGRENENLPEGDARRYLTSRQKKAFNTGTNALKVKLADAIEMLNERVFE